MDTGLASSLLSRYIALLFNLLFTVTNLFLQLIEKIIPAFEKAHGPGFQALIMVDNSQGHSAYAIDALLVSRMNLRPGGKQARMRDGWFMRRGNEKVTQSMVFPPDHLEFPNEPKGMKQVLIERGLWDNRLKMQCKTCPGNST